MNANSLEERTFTVYDGKILQLPTLTMSDLRIASSPQGRAFVEERIHTENMNGFPLVELYRDHGVILQPLNSSTTHVLVVLNDEKALDMMAMIHHTYSLLGYTLIFDETTVFHTLSEPVESAEPQQTTIKHDEENLNEVELPSKTQGRQSKLDVLGMEVA
jgi:hypothetical protein